MAEVSFTVLAEDVSPTAETRQIGQGGCLTGGTYVYGIVLCAGWVFLSTSLDRDE